MIEKMLSDSTFISALVSALVSGSFALAIYLRTARAKQFYFELEQAFDRLLQLREQEYQTINATIATALTREIVHAEQIIAVEASIDEQALSLYGINLDGAHKDVTPSRIRYLVAIINAQNLRFDRTESDPSRLKEMFSEAEDYMPRLFAQPITREVWRYARRCFRKILRDNIDQHVLTRYENELKSHPLEAL